MSSRCFINDGVGAWRGQHSLEEPLYQTGAVNLIKTGQMQGDVPFCFGPETVSRGLEVIRQTILPGRRFFPAAAVCSHSVEWRSATPASALGPPG